MVAAEEELDFHGMGEAEMRQWVEANPGRVNDRDRHGETPLHTAIYEGFSLPLVLWLVDEKGADLNATTSKGQPPLHEAGSFDIFTALLDRGAKPHSARRVWLLPSHETCALREHQGSSSLLEDPRVRATVYLQGSIRQTALHLACKIEADHNRDCIVRLLLRAGAKPDIADYEGNTPLACLRKLRPNHATISLVALLDRAPGTDFVALLKQASDAEMASLLVNTRRLIIAIPVLP